MGTPVTDTTIEAKARAAAPVPAERKDATVHASEGPGAESPASPDAPPPAAPPSRKRRPRGPAADSDAAGAEHADSPPAVPAIDPSTISASVEAILLSADRPVPPARIAEAIAPATAKASSALADGSGPTLSAATIRDAVDLLNQAYDREGRAFRIEPVSGGLRIMTRPEHAEVLARFHGQRAHTRLSRAGLETLAIIAYRQPITRAEIESIRGVASGEILKTLLERRLVTITGRAEEVGRPMLYGTTRQFLESFGLASVKDLPPPEEFGLAPATPPIPAAAPPPGV